MQRRLIWVALVAVGCLFGPSAWAASPGHDRAAGAVRGTGDAPPAYPRLWEVDAVDMLSSDDVWAVGDKFSHSGQRPWVGHWDGTAWQEQRTRHRFPGFLDDVAALSHDDVWAVGALAKGRVGSLIEHWDGDGWTRFGHSPSDGALWAVSGHDADDVWAVGIFDRQGLVQHWNGQHWHLAKASVDGHPLPALRDVAVVAPDDVWAISLNEVFHWDGSAWTLVALSSHGQHYQLRQLVMRSARDGWLVGAATIDGRAVPLSLHWDGNKWHRAPARGFPPDRTFTAVTVVAPHDVWAAGQDPDYTAHSIIVAHWDGQQWQPVDAPDRGRLTAVTGIAGVADNDIWMTGETLTGHGFLAHWDGSTWTTVP